MHQDDSGGTYSEVKIDDDDDDDNDDDDDAVSWHIVWQTWRLRDKKNNMIFSYFQQFCPQLNYEANEHVTPAKD